MAAYAYTDKTAVQNYTLTDIDSGFDMQLTEWIAAMSEHIDQRVGYPIYTLTATERLYDGSGSEEQLIGAVNTITAVTVDGVAVTPVYGPYNAPTKTYMILQNQYFSVGYANVSVTGKHCLLPTVPSDVKLACTILVAGIVNQSNNQTDGVKSEKIGEYQITYTTEEEQKQYQWAKTVIDGYRKVYF